VADRLVVVVDDNGKPATTAVVLDDEGHLVATHACAGGLYHPSPPTAIDVWDDRIVLTELVDEETKPICAFRLDAGARTEQAGFPLGTDVFVTRGHLFASRAGGGGAGKREVRRVDHNLRLASAVTDPRTPRSNAFSRCTGITGDATWQSELVDGLVVTRTGSCCGGTAPAGIFVCDPGTGADP
jgi:hypothetical protein